MILGLIIFRGFVYRLSVKYNEVGTRPEIEITNERLIEKIQNASAGKRIGANEIVKIACKVTSKELRFSTSQVSHDPNQLINTHRANCVGYSAMFNSIANYLIEVNGLSDEIRAEHKIGQLEFLGFNLHSIFDDPFFSDHDFNEIKVLNTGEVISVDPSVSDYLWISRISK